MLEHGGQRALDGTTCATVTSCSHAEKKDDVLFSFPYGVNPRLEVLILFRVFSEVGRT